VMSGINPQGCQVFSFKSPSAEELDHDFLWRTSRSLPERGRIGIFNRSYYEEVLAVRVHPEFLAKQKLPPEVITKRIWEERFEDIRAFERYMARQGYLILKFFLNVSKKAQKDRFLERLDLPEKNWKFSMADAKERGYWGAYMRAYQDLIRATATPEAPWYVVPADKKWFSRIVVAAVVHHALEKLQLGPELVEFGGHVQFKIDDGTLCETNFYNRFFYETSSGRPKIVKAFALVDLTFLPAKYWDQMAKLAR